MNRSGRRQRQFFRLDYRGRPERKSVAARRLAVEPRLGAIRVEIPPAARFEVNATTNFGKVLINRDDIEKPDAEVRQLHQKVNGCGKRMEMHTDSSRIVIR